MVGSLPNCVRSWRCVSYRCVMIRLQQSPEGRGIQRRVLSKSANLRVTNATVMPAMKSVQLL